MEADVQLFCFFSRKLLHDILRNVHSHFSCTYQIQNKTEGCSILFTTSPASACPAFSFLGPGFEPGSNESSVKQEGLILLSNVKSVRSAS